MVGLPLFHPLGLYGGIIALVFGIVVLFFPRVPNYLIGIYLIVSGVASFIAGGTLLLMVGALSFVVGVLVMVFPTVLNYLVGIYLILLGSWLIFGLSSVELGLPIGIVTFILGIVVMILPTILNYLFGIYLIVIGLFAVIRFLINWL
jgi:uncharacterized membrane protein HdeD (DUF308 family)